jgi:RNA polymerase sigma-70 factor, ECF subfamily
VGGEKKMADPLEEMYQAYKEPVFRYLRNMCQSRTIAEELTHDTFIKAFKG